MLEKILIIQTAFLGDAILTLPMIQKLKEIFPESQIDVVAIPKTKEIFSASVFVNKVYAFEKRGVHKTFFGLRKFAKSLKNEKYTRLYSPHRSLRTSLLVLLTGIKETYGFSSSEFKFVYKNIVHYESGRHEVQRNLDLIGFRYDDLSWKIKPIIKEDFSDNVKNLLNLANGRRVACAAIGSIWATKKYPIEYYLEIIKFLIKEKYFVILVGGEDDKAESKNLADRIEEGIISASGNLGLRESVALLSRSALLICNDSAPAHLGQAANVKTVMLYCSTVPGFGFSPYLPGSFYLSYNDLKCKPCGIHGFKKCPINTFECAKQLTPELVIKKIKEEIK